MQRGLYLKRDVLSLTNRPCFFWRANIVMASNTTDETQTSMTDESENKISAETRPIGKKVWKLETDLYSGQNEIWPRRGQHILAQYDDTSVVVYQAFKSSIAQFAVDNQRFGGPDYNPDRMSWIKTNFMWMMYRCGWAQKANQERILAIRITRQGFEDILSKAYTPWRQKAEGISKDNIEVRLQWDPDHDPHGGKLERRAIQLGLKGKTLADFGGDHILNIKDITDFVHEQYAVLKDQGPKKIMSPRERVYTPDRGKTCRDIGLDFQPEQRVVGFSA